MAPEKDATSWKDVVARRKPRKDLVPGTWSWAYEKWGDGWEQCLVCSHITSSAKLKHNGNVCAKCERTIQPWHDKSSRPPKGGRRGGAAAVAGTGDGDTDGQRVLAIKAMAAKIVDPVVRKAALLVFDEKAETPTPARPAKLEEDITKAAKALRVAKDTRDRALSKVGKCKEAYEESIAEAAQRQVEFIQAEKETQAALARTSAAVIEEPPKEERSVLYLAKILEDGAADQIHLDLGCEDDMAGPEFTEEDRQRAADHRDKVLGTIKKTLYESLGGLRSLVDKHRADFVAAQATIVHEAKKRRTPEGAVTVATDVGPVGTAPLEAAPLAAGAAAGACEPGSAADAAAASPPRARDAPSEGAVGAAGVAMFGEVLAAAESIIAAAAPDATQKSSAAKPKPGEAKGSGHSS